MAGSIRPGQRLHGHWATNLRRNVTAVTSRWPHCADLTGPGIELQTSRTNSNVSATELNCRACSKLAIAFFFMLVSFKSFVFQAKIFFQYYAFNFDGMYLMWKEFPVYTRSNFSQEIPIEEKLPAAARPIVLTRRKFTTKSKRR